MKIWFAALLLLPVLAFGNTFKNSAFYKDSSLVFIDQLQEGSTYKIGVTSYACFTLATIQIEITRDCNGYTAIYKRASGMVTLDMQPDVIRTLQLTSQQLEVIKEFERNMFSGTPLAKRCDNTTYYTVMVDKLVKTYRDTDCRVVNGFLALKKTFESDATNALAVSAN